MSFHPVAVVVRLVQKEEIDSTKKKQLTKLYKNNTKHIIHKIENENTKQETNIKRILTL